MSEISHVFSQSSRLKPGKVKVKCSHYRPVEVQLYSSMTAALEGGEWSAARPGCTLPLRRTRHPLYRRLGGLQGRSGWAENLVPHRDSIPDCPACSQLLYRMSYLALWLKPGCFLKSGHGHFFPFLSFINNPTI